MMILITAALFAIPALASTVQKPNCNGTIVNGINHEMEILIDGLEKPYQLAIDHDTSVLYFSYTGSDDIYTVFESGYINLKTKEFNKMKGIWGAFANAVDPKTHNVYIGGSDGIYIFNNETDTAVKLKISNASIWQIFVKDNIYFTTYPEEEAFVYRLGVTERVAEIGNYTAMLIALDDKYNMYYCNATGLFVYKNNTGKTLGLGDYVVNAFAKDVNGKLYFSTPGGVYKIYEDGLVRKIADISNVYGLVIDSDGSIIYADVDSIIKLKSTSDECVSEIKSLDNQNNTI